MDFHLEERCAWVRTSTHTVIFDRDREFPRFAGNPTGVIARLIRVWQRDASGGGLRAYLGAIWGRLPEAEMRWRPPDGGWSILEIVTHITDEETEDFGRRLELMLRDPAEPWPPIDTEAAAVERRYNDGDLAAVIARFVSDRRDSVTRLRGLDNPDWSITVHHKLGDVRAGDLLASWVAHDALHLRQIAKRMFQLTQRDSGEYSTAYAGSWTA